MRFAVVAVGLALAAVSPTVAAQPRLDAAARSFYQNGAAAFQAGRYDEAARAFREAHAISHAPELLFNLALALERGGDYRGALQSLTDFRNAGAPNYERATLDRQIESLRPRAAEQEEAERRRAAGEAAPTEPRVEVRERRVIQPAFYRVEHRRSALNTVGPWVTLGLGAAVGVAGIIQGVAVSGDVATLNDVNAGRSPWSDDAQGALDRAPGGVTRAWILGSVGGAMVVGGALWLLLRGSGERRVVNVAPTLSVTEGGAALGLGGAL